MSASGNKSRVQLPLTYVEGTGAMGLGVRVWSSRVQLPLTYAEGMLQASSMALAEEP